MPNAIPFAVPADAATENRSVFEIGPTPVTVTEAVPAVAACAITG